LALAQAMLADGRPAEAEQTLRTLLDRTETNGPANLTMARLRLALGHSGDAISYYHRAIFGEWGADSSARRLEARLELIDVLRRRNQREAMLAELLPLEVMRVEDDSLRRVIAHLFIEAGAPKPSAAMFRNLLRDHRNDADSYTGLGEADLALGNFRTAHGNFAAALRLHPGDATIAHRMEVADSALAIDPTHRGLGAATRWKLSQLLLSRTVAALERCGYRLTPQRADSLRAIASRHSPRDAVTEAELAIGEALSLWASRPVSCQRRPFFDEPLSLVLDNAAQ
jgi:tetratricopeptide (TPR) repeat protein